MQIVFFSLSSRPSWDPLTATCGTSLQLVGLSSEGCETVTYYVFWDQVCILENPPGTGFYAVSTWASDEKDRVEQGACRMLGEPTSDIFLA